MSNFILGVLVGSVIMFVLAQETTVVNGAMPNGGLKQRLEEIISKDQR